MIITPARFQERSDLKGLLTVYTPTTWAPTKHASNPVIAVTAGEPNEQYVPCPVLVNGTTYCAVKGVNDIYLWSASDGVAFTIMNGGTAIITNGAAGTWNEHHVWPLVMLLDPDGVTMRIYGAGQNSGQTTAGVGLFTANISTLTSWSEGGSNPLITNAAVETATGLSGVRRVRPRDIVKIGSTYYMYLTVGVGNASVVAHQHICYATATSLDGPWTVQSIILSYTSLPAPHDAQHDYGLAGIVGILGLNVFKRGNLYYGIHEIARTDANRYFAGWGTSSDGITWRWQKYQTILGRGTGSDWDENRVYAGEFLKVQDGNYDTLQMVSGNYRFYYSGSNPANTTDQVGLAQFSAIPDADPDLYIR